jgi:hypothetical protein
VLQTEAPEIGGYRGLRIQQDEQVKGRARLARKLKRQRSQRFHLRFRLRLRANASQAVSGRTSNSCIVEQQTLGEDVGLHHTVRNEMDARPRALRLY